jgi:hypothetical protein
MVELKLRDRNIAHAWWDKRVFRYLSKHFSGKECIYIVHIYMILCQIDSDFCEREENPSKGIKGIVQTCATYAKMEKRTISKYMSILRDLLLIDYGQERRGRSGKLGQSFLKLYLFDENIHNKELIENRGKCSHTTVKNPESTVVSVHRPRSGVSHKNTSNSLKNESKDSKSFSKEKDGPSAEGRTKNTLLLKIKKRKKTNNNGLLYNSLAKPTGRADLSKWLDNHNINRHDDREKSIHEFQTKLFAKKISPATEQIKEVLDYWNKIAFGARNNGHKLPVHQIKDTKTIYMCQLIITGILHTSGHTVGDLKKAIDNYSWILENSPWYNKIYPFPKFFSNKKLFDDCITDNVRTNNRYINPKRKLSREGLLMVAKEEFGRVNRRKMTYNEEEQYKWWIQEGDIKTEEDARRYAQ